MQASRSHGSISGSAIASYLGVFLLVMTMVAVAYQPPVNSQTRADVSVTPQTQQETTKISVDNVMATTLASSLAESTDMPVAADVANLSQSLAIESAMAQTETDAISKPQIIQPTAGSHATQKYTTVAGDTVAALSAKYGISVNTIKWANGLTAETLDPGKVLAIMPVDGVLYTVKSGDTLDSIVAKYGSDSQSIKAFNDLELTGNPVVGSQIVIPGGVLPDTERPGYVAPITQTTTINYGNYGSWGGGSTWRNAEDWSGRPVENNGYPFGQCTYYAAVRRAQLGNPVGRQWGNGGLWRYSGAAAGRLVDNNPSAGAVMDGNGHVAIVESVDVGNAIYISEMNARRGGGGWGRVDYMVISWGEATSGMYKYVH